MDITVLPKQGGDEALFVFICRGEQGDSYKDTGYSFQKVNEALFLRSLF